MTKGCTDNPLGLLHFRWGCFLFSGVLFSLLLRFHLVSFCENCLHWFIYGVSWHFFKFRTALLNVFFFSRLTACSSNKMEKAFFKAVFPKTLIHVLGNQSHTIRLSASFTHTHTLSSTLTLMFCFTASYVKIKNENIKKGSKIRRQCWERNSLPFHPTELFCAMQEEEWQERKEQSSRDT